MTNIFPEEVSYEHLFYGQVPASSLQAASDFFQTAFRDTLSASCPGLKSSNLLLRGRSRGSDGHHLNKEDSNSSCSSSLNVGLVFHTVWENEAACLNMINLGLFSSPPLPDAVQVGAAPPPPPPSLALASSQVPGLVITGSDHRLLLQGHLKTSAATAAAANNDKGMDEIKESAGDQDDQDLNDDSIRAEGGGGDKMAARRALFLEQLSRSLISTGSENGPGAEPQEMIQVTSPDDVQEKYPTLAHLKPDLGCRLVRASDDLAMVQDVDVDGPAARAFLAHGDLVVAISETSVSTMWTISPTLAVVAGDLVMFRVKRQLDGREEEVLVEVGATGAHVQQVRQLRQEVAGDELAVGTSRILDAEQAAMRLLELKPSLGAWVAIGGNASGDSGLILGVEQGGPLARAIGELETDSNVDEVKAEHGDSIAAAAVAATGENTAPKVCVLSVDSFEVKSGMELYHLMMKKTAGDICTLRYVSVNSESAESSDSDAKQAESTVLEVQVELAGEDQDVAEGAPGRQLSVEAVRALRRLAATLLEGDSMDQK